jgi:hypothetical protein
VLSIVRPLAAIMWLIKQLGYLRIGRVDGDTAEHRVLHLFRNRAELKKA